MADVLESLEIQVKHNASGADAAINSVADAITNLKTAITGTPKELRDLASAMSAMSSAFKGGAAKFSAFADGVADIAAAAGLLGSGTSTLNDLASALVTISGVTIDPVMLTGLSRALGSLASVTSRLAGIDSKLSSLATSLGGLGAVAPGIASFTAALTGLSGVTVDAAMFNRLSRALPDLATALSGLAPYTAVLEGLATALSGLSGITIDPDIFSRLATALNRIARSLTTLSGSLTTLTALSSLLRGLSGVVFDVRTLNAVARAITHIAEAAAAMTPDAMANLERLISALGMLSTLSLNNVADSLASLARNLPRVASAANRAGTNSRNAGKGFRDMGDSAKKSNSALATLFSSLKRIAFYRLIRAIIKAITEAFKKGSENAFFFSDAISGMGHRFATALNSISTKALTMQNQLGSAFNALMTAIAPIIEYLIGLVTKLADAISQLFSVFTGDTYLKAVDVPNKWATDANKATKAAKEWKNQLLGFDEINRLSEPNDNSGGGGSEKLDPTTMFKDTPIDNVFVKMKAALKDFIGSFDLGPLTDAWNNLKTAIKGVADTIGGILKWAWENVLNPFAHWMVEAGLPDALNLLSEALGIFADLDFTNVKNSLETLFSKLSPFATLLSTTMHWALKNVLEPLAKWTIEDAVPFAVDLLSEALEGLSSIDFSDTLESVKKFLNKLKQLAGIVGVALQWCLTNVLIPLGKWTIEEVVPRAIDVLTSAVGLLSAALMWVKPYAKWFWEKFLKPLSSFAGETIIAFLEDFKWLLDEIAAAFRGEKTAGQLLKDVLERIHYRITETMDWLEKNHPNLWHFIHNAKDWCVDAWATIKEAWQSLKTKVSNGITALKLKWQAFKDKIHEGKEDLVNDWNRIKEGWVNLKASVSNGIANLKQSWQTFKDKIREGKEDLVKDWNRIKEGWVGLKASISNGVENLKAKWQTFKDKIAEGKADLVKDWNRIKEGWVGLKASINNGIENVKAKWQTFRDKIAEGKADLVNDWNRIQSGWVNLKASISNGVENLKSKWDSFKEKIAEGKADLAQDWENLKQTWLNLKASIANGIENLKLNWDALKNRVVEAIDKIKAKWDELKAKWDEKLEPLREAVANWKESWVSAFNAVRNAIVSLFGWILTAWTAFKGFLNDLTSNPIGEQWGEDNTFISPTDGRTIKMPFMNGAASGGVFDEGEIFVAREAGPEMVGTIGGHTAVANNDQIVDGIRQGVFEAVSAAMSNRTSDGVQEIRVFLDSREIRAGQQRLNRAWGT